MKVFPYFKLTNWGTANGRRSIVSLCTLILARYTVEKKATLLMFQYIKLTYTPSKVVLMSGTFYLFFFYYVTALKYDFPSVPMKLLNATNMPRKQKDKIRKKQENIDRTLETIVIEENTFLEVFRDMPMEVRHFLLFLA